MTKYLISFPSEAMVLTADELPTVASEAHAVLNEAKAAGVYVFGGGVEERVEPVLVAANGSVSAQISPDSHIKGGFTVLEVSTRAEAVEWARKIALACRCSQELREFMVVHHSWSIPSLHMNQQLANTVVRNRGMNTIDLHL